jgi:hypothetical protein
MTTNFVTDLTSLPFPKSDKIPLPATEDPNKAVVAADWNTLCQASIDLRSAVLAGLTNTRLTAFLGDSNFTSQGVTTDLAQRQDDVFTADARCVLDKLYGTSSSEPIPLVDMGRGPLRIANVSSFPGFGPELGFGKEMPTLRNGFGAAATETNKPWIVSLAISGVRLLDFLPAATYGTATPAFGGLNAYGAFKARIRAAEAASGRTLSTLASNLGPNDGANATDAALVASRWVTFWSQFKIDFPNTQLILLQMNVNCDVAFRPTVVRPQIALAASQIPGSRLVVADDLRLNSDAIHYGPRAIYTIGGRFAAAERDIHGLLSRTATIPAFLGYGQADFHPVSGSSTTLTPSPYPLAQGRQLQLLMCGSMKNSGSYVAIPSPTVPAAGWTQLGNSTQAISGQTQGFALFSRAVTQADLDTNAHNVPGATVLMSNDESYCKLFTLFGSNSLALDGSVTTFKETGFSNTAFAAAGVTTAVANSLVVIAFVTQGGGLSLTEHFTVTNSNLANLTIISDEPYGGLSTGNFGILVFAVGTMVTPGATGNTTITKSASFNAAVCGFTAAFKVA